MNKTTHTPGPWVWLDRGDWHELVHFVPGELFPNGEPRYVRVHSDGSAGGEYGPDIQHDGPDGRLIAAAPALKAACETLLAYDRETSPPAERELLARAVEQARAALKLCEVQQ